MIPIFKDFPLTLEERIIELNSANESLLAEITKQEDIKPDKGWSISEITYHLYIVEKGITGMLQKALLSQERCERKSDETLKKEWETITSFTLNRQERFNAPSFTLPNNTPILSEVIPLLTQLHEKLVNLLKNTSVEELASIEKPHAIESVGLISGLGWLSLIAGHKLRHVEQIKELKHT